MNQYAVGDKVKLKAVYPITGALRIPAGTPGTVLRVDPIEPGIDLITVNMDGSVFELFLPDTMFEPVTTEIP